MTLTIDRRSLILTGALGLGALAIPGFALAAPATGFTHNVASGEPAATSVLLWTRYVGSDSGTTLRCEVAETPDFARIVAGGEQTTGPWRDGTVKVTVHGLKPGTWYHFRFVAPDGTMSPIGRTKTLPAGGARTWRAAIFSCSNMGYGWFNAYAHAAARRDLDCWIHLGDYFYEYAPDHYPPATDAVPGRVPEPASETIHLADYRLRFASYRSDPDLQRLHATLPVIAQWDDHESANDSWEGGAQNHDPAAEGDWSARRDASVQAYREWMPISEEPWSAYQVGDLATLFRTETRLLARTRQKSYGDLLRTGDPAKVLAAFRDGAWRDPAMTMMGSEQELWLDRAIRASVTAGTKWQVVASGTNMGRIRVPPAARGWLSPDNARARAYVEAGIAAGAAGLPNNLDNWGGYPAARARFLQGALAAEADLIVITGDSHNAWAFDLEHDGRAAGVELGGHSVTSPGYESGLATDPRAVARALVGFNPELKWCDTARRGYMAMTVTPDRVANDWVFVDTIKTRTPRASVGFSTSVAKGRRVMAV